jgi:ABC-type phosphate transport system permease subunit
MTGLNPFNESQEAAKARRRRSLALALGLVLFVVVIFIVTLARLKGHVIDRHL